MTRKRPVKKEKLLSEEELRYFFNTVNSIPLNEILTEINKVRLRFTGKRVLKLQELKKVYNRWLEQTRKLKVDISSPGKSLSLQRKEASQVANEYVAIEFPSLSYLPDELGVELLRHPAWQDALREIDFD